MLLENLYTPLDRIKGVGTESLKAFAQLGIVNIGDLLRHYPASYEDRQNLVPLANSSQHKACACRAKVMGHDTLKLRGEDVLKVRIADDSAEAYLLCFGRHFLHDKLAVGQDIFVYGSFTIKYLQLQCSNFEVEVYSTQPTTFGKILPIYPLSNGLSQNKLRKVIQQAFELCPIDFETLVPLDFLQEQGWPTSKRQWLQALHCPVSLPDIEQARQCLIFEELYLFQVSLLYRRQLIRNKKRVALRLPMQLYQKVRLSLPFELTGDQQKAIADMMTDLQQDYPMRRLLQGDVGSGKTLVSLLAACPLFEEGQQVAFMAPTELLARQHAESAARWLEPMGVKVAFLTGNVGNAGRKQVLQYLANGTIQLVVGTHALFSDEVKYHNLALAIIDEQHRFGVAQRERLLSKGNNPDLLLMTATPIPRTLALSVFGELDVSYLREKPVGRLPIKTHLASSQNIARVHQFVLQQLEAGYQAYYVYPLIEGQEQSDIKAAEDMYRTLKDEVFTDYKVGMIHARMDEESKRLSMQAFAKGQYHILVATSVVEVGIDVANATVMVIEACQRFGLASLHQLRGRVGRSAIQSHCFLVYDDLTDEAKQRLKVLYESNDGFVIAEADLKQRGPGQFSGYKQSGVARFALAQLERDAQWLSMANRLAVHTLGQADSSALIINYLQHLQENGSAV